MKLSWTLCSFLRRAGLCVSAACIVTGSALATWSIVAVNTKTGEICIASATCIEDFVLQAGTPVLRVGYGAAACQSLIDSTGVNRMKIWSMLPQGYSPDEMLQRVLATDNHASNRQYGIVNFTDFPATFTGPQCGTARYGVAGHCDDIRYAIQGNVLTGVAPVYYAETALISTPGDLGQKVMAAMEAARSMGGDGRCSCDINVPDHCGSPPPSFVYSAYTAFLVIARMGDHDGVCDAGGCCNGNYYCDLQAISDSLGPEPVLWLEAHYANWRANQQGFADHIKSEVHCGLQSMPADAISRTTIDVQLKDIDGHPVVHQPALLTVTRDYDGPPVAHLSPIINHGNGHFSFVVAASDLPGQGKWKLEVTHGEKTVLLWPELSIRIDPLTELHSGYDQLSASNGASVPLVVNTYPAERSAPYLILGSASGTSPGTVFDGLNLPLNRDPFFQASLDLAGSPHFTNTAGLLDELGHAQASFVAPPMLLATYIGRHIDWCGVLHGAVPHVTNVAGFDVVP
jgi:hypothetical protein